MMRYEKKRADVLGLTMAYIDVGEGHPIVFLHGNPTSSFLWRNVIPHLESMGRCIAPDLIGMGDSGKLPDSGRGSYRYVHHREHLFALFDQIGVEDNVTFVVHDWGSALGFDWAFQHQDAVKGVAYMEAVVRPFSWSNWPEDARRIIEGTRSEAGEDMVLEKNIFIEAMLPGLILRTLSDEEMAEYRRPYLEPGESRRAMLTWPREVPIEGEPADVHEIVSAYSTWLQESELPKLFISADPGAIIQGATAEFCRTFPNQQEASVQGLHFIQEDAPDDIGRAIANWYPSL